MSNNPAGFYVHRSAIEAHKRFVGPHVTITKLANGELYEQFVGFSDGDMARVRYVANVHYVDLTLSPNLTKIPDQMFGNNMRIKKVILNNNITSIGKNAFWRCSNLEEINFPSSLISIGDYAFQSCVKLRFPSFEYIQSIGAQCFSLAGADEYLKLGSSIISIGNYSFLQLPAVKHLEIAATKLDPGQMFFRQSTNLKKVWIRNTCTTIKAQSAAYSPFVECPTDLEIYAEPASKPSGWSQYFNRTGANGGTTVSVVYGQTTSPF